MRPRLTFIALSTSFILAESKEPIFFITRSLSMVRIWSHWMMLGESSPPSPLAVQTSVGYFLLISFWLVMTATIVRGENLLPMSFWITRHGLVFLFSAPLAGFRSTRTVSPCLNSRLTRYSLRPHA